MKYIQHITFRYLLTHYCNVQTLERESNIVSNVVVIIDVTENMTVVNWIDNSSARTSWVLTLDEDVSPVPEGLHKNKSVVDVERQTGVGAAHCVPAMHFQLNKAILFATHG